MIQPVTYNSISDTVEMIDQTKLPRSYELIICRTHSQVADAIKTMKVRGAPAIGVAGAFGMYLGAREYSKEEAKFPAFIQRVHETLAATRPTAVNLFWALKHLDNVIKKAYGKAPEGKKLAAVRKEALKEAKAVLADDIEMCKVIGRYGSQFLQDGQAWLTHCNAGALATGGYGTALGVFWAAKAEGKRFSVFVDETRPLLQGSRLTAWELKEEGIPSTLICDNMSASLMSAGRIQGIVVGADRITAEGYVANKIGTYAVAVLAHYHKIPFYVAAPASTFDLTIDKGTQITIEERASQEVSEIAGIGIAPENFKVFNPAFDVTPPELVTAIITNMGVIRPPFKSSIKKALKSFFS